LPNYKELVSILNLENDAPAVSQAFNNNCSAPCTVLACSCTSPTPLWSSSSYAPFLEEAWVVDLGDGSVLRGEKTNRFMVRAVRGGS
jgi:hypothetical protein